MYRERQEAQRKSKDVLKKIRECIEQDRYEFSKHALDRVKERRIDIDTALYVLLNGYEDKQKTIFDNDNNNWKYAIRGKTVDDIDIRIIVVIDEDGMIIITVMYVL